MSLDLSWCSFHISGGLNAPYHLKILLTQGKNTHLRMEFEKEVPFQLGKEYCGGYLNILEGESAFFESPDKPFWKDFFDKFSKKSLEYRVET